jgi:hypothetical protein
VWRWQPPSPGLDDLAIEEPGRSVGCLSRTIGQEGIYITWQVADWTGKAPGLRLVSGHVAQELGRMKLPSTEGNHDDAV